MVLLSLYNATAGTQTCVAKRCLNTLTQLPENKAVKWSLLQGGAVCLHQTLSPHVLAVDDMSLRKIRYRFITGGKK